MGSQDQVSSPFNDAADAAPGIWNWLKGAANGVKNLADENPTATKWITFGLAAIMGISWGGELADWILRAFPSMNNGFTSFLVHGIALVGALVAANALSQWVTNRPGAQEHRQDVAQANAEQTQELLDQRAAIMRANGRNPDEVGVDQSNSKAAFLKANRNHVMGTQVQMNDASLRPSGDHPQGQTYQPQMYGGRGAYDRTTDGRPNWSAIPPYPVVR